MSEANTLPCLPYTWPTPYDEDRDGSGLGVREEADMASKIEDLKMNESTRRTHITVRLDEVAMSRLDRFQEEYGGTRSRAVEMLLKGTRPVRVTKSSKEISLDEDSIKQLNEVKDAYREASFQLQKIGVNVNQMAKKLNTRKVAPGHHEIGDLIKALELVSIEFEDTIKDIT